MLRSALGVFLILHGVAHLVGFAVPWQLVKPADQPYRTTILAGAVDLCPAGIKAFGLAWLALGMAVAALGVTMLMDRVSYRAVVGILGASLLLGGRLAGRANRTLGSRFFMLLLEPAAFLMTRRMLLGIRCRAENHG